MLKRRSSDFKDDAKTSVSCFERELGRHLLPRRRSLLLTKQSPYPEAYHLILFSYHFSNSLCFFRAPAHSPFSFSHPAHPPTAPSHVCYSPLHSRPADSISPPSSPLDTVPSAPCVCGGSKCRLCRGHECGQVSRRR